MRDVCLSVVAWKLFNALPERVARADLVVEGRVALADRLLKARSIVF